MTIEIYNIRVSQILFAYDPMHLDCVSNLSFDEYDLIAAHIVEHARSGMPLEQAIYESFKYWFGNDEEEDQFVFDATNLVVPIQIVLESGD